MARFEPGNDKGGLKKGEVLRDFPMREVRAVNRKIVEETLAQYMTKSYGAIKQIHEDDTKPALHRMVASVIVNAIENGDASRLNFLLDRTIGPVKKQLELTNEHEETLRAIPIENLITVANSLVKRDRLPGNPE